VTIPITGVVSLRMACASRDTRTNRQRGMYAAFGDPVVVYG